MTTQAKQTRRWAVDGSVLTYHLLNRRSIKPTADQRVAVFLGSPVHFLSDIGLQQLSNG